jgi:hypothetical protein
MTVREISALLYLPGQTATRLERALAIPALSAGWRHSFEALREQLRQGATGNRGLAPPSAGPPAWKGLRPFRVTDVVRESRSIASFALAPVDGEPLPPFRPGQYLTVRVQPPGAPRALLRSFSLAAAPDTRRYRLGIKREGVVSTHLHEHVAPGDALEVGAPRGLFTLAAESDAPLGGQRDPPAADHAHPRDLAVTFPGVGLLLEDVRAVGVADVHEPADAHGALQRHRLRRLDPVHLLVGILEPLAQDRLDACRAVGLPDAVRRHRAEVDLGMQQRDGARHVPRGDRVHERTGDSRLDGGHGASVAHAAGTCNLTYSHIGM